MLERYCLKKIVRKAEERWKKAHEVKDYIIEKYGRLYHGAKFVVKEFRKDDILDGISVFKLLHTDGILVDNKVYLFTYVVEQFPSGEVVIHVAR